MSHFSKEDIKHLIMEDEITFIRLQFTDIFGRLKNITIPVNQLDEALNGQIMFDGSSIKGFVRIEESDMYLRPDPTTYCVYPWKSSNRKGKVARLICDIYKPDGTPFEGCPRNVLKKALKKLEKYNYNFYVGPEVEFFLFHTDERGKPIVETHDDAGYFDLAPTDLGEEARQDMCIVLQEMGFEIEASHHEAAPGQHEIDFKYDDALKTADNIATFKLVVKTIAKQHGLHATFMPKPLRGTHGTCMHINQSLFLEGKNLFYDKNDELELSDIARFYIGGLIKHAKEFAAITNSSVNSYKRLTSGYEAPIDIAWSTGNRSPLIRVPSKRGLGTRVELRNPDPTANQYTALAAILCAGLDGIENKTEPPECINENVYDLSSSEKKENGVEKFPASLIDAVNEMEKSDFMKEAIGEHIYSIFINAMKQEWKEFNQEIHDWEIKRYLALF